MNENDYFMDIIYHLGFAINDKNNSETILNYHLKNENKSLYYSINPFFIFQEKQKIEEGIYDFWSTKQ